MKTKKIKPNHKSKKRKTIKKWKNGNINSFVLSESKVKKTVNIIKKLKKYDIKDELKIHLPASNQHYSGRCWLFAYLNILRLSVIVHYKLHETYSFSTSYLLFWDKYEKCKYFLERVSDYSNVSLDDINNHLLFRSIMSDSGGSVSDGGTWNMLYNLIQKYGIVPYKDMKESFHTVSTDQLNTVLFNVLTTTSKEIRSSPKKEHEKIIQKQMKKIYEFLKKALGTPPKKVQLIKGKPKYSPKIFFEKCISILPGNKLNNKIVLLHVPHLKVNQYYTISDLNNMKHGEKVLYFNTSLSTLKKTIINQLLRKFPVWFGSDVNLFHYEQESLLNNSVYNYHEFEFNKKNMFLKKENAIPYYQTNVNHAMLFHGFYFKDSKQKPSYWIVENSHGSKLDETSYDENYGYIKMSDSWFNKHVIMAIVNKDSILNKDIHEKIKNKENIIELPKWCNLGELL